LLELKAPDPARELWAALGVDTTEMKQRLGVTSA
jgi:hypothetical protein